MTSDILVAFNSIVVECLLYENLFKFMLVNFLWRYTNLNYHLDDLTKLRDFNNSTITFFLDFRHDFLDQLLFDLMILYNLLLELRHLEMLNAL